MSTEERMTVETVDICPCGLVMHQANDDDYDSGGSDSGICCPDCGNEEFTTIKQLQAENKELTEMLRNKAFYTTLQRKFEQLQSDLNKYKEVLERIHKIAGTIKGKGTKQAFEIWNIIDQALKGTENG